MSERRGSRTNLPDFDAPPVGEIVGSVQFNPIPYLGLRQMIDIGNRFDGYDLLDLQPQLPPIQEFPPGTPAPPPFPQMFLGQQPQRALYGTADQRFIAQLQQDRIAINERRIGLNDDPSSLHVWPQLERLSEIISESFPGGEGFWPESANLVELTYVNLIRGASIDQVLRIVSPEAGEAPYATAEQRTIGFSFPIFDADTFRGRLHVQAGPSLVEGMPVLQVQLISRRIVDKHSPLAQVFDACHREAVLAFAAVTEPAMHRIWRRTK